MIDRERLGPMDRMERPGPLDRIGIDRGLDGRPASGFDRGGWNDRGHAGPPSYHSQGPPPPGPGHFRHSGPGRPPSPPPSLSLPVPQLPPSGSLVYQHIEPLKSYKSFMHDQKEDLSPEQFRVMYEKYHLTYLDSFSHAFFKATKDEEWFRDRYDPLRRQEQENEANAWAAKESAVIRNSLTASPAATIAAMCLDPVTPAVPSVAKVDDNAPDAEPQDCTVSVSGKHFSGHEDSTVYVVGIHSSCPKAVFRAAVVGALEKENIPAPVRIVLSLPMWCLSKIGKGEIRFERSAWVVLSSNAHAKAAVQVLRDLRVVTPGPEEGPAGGLFRGEFKVGTALLHSPKHVATVPDSNSWAPKIAADFARAQELAAQLDEVRGVPAESRLQAILDLAQISPHCIKPTDRLDIAIAFLRRVHFVSFYSGKRATDEAHLLTLAPACTFRVAPGMVEDSSQRSESKVAAKTTESLKRRRDEEEDNSAEGGADKAAAESEETSSGAASSGGEPAKQDTGASSVGDDSAIGGGEKEGAASLPVAPRLPVNARQQTRVRLLEADKRVDDWIADLRHRIEWRKRCAEEAPAAAPSPNTAWALDEVDVRTISKRQEELYTRAIELECKRENEGKMRCCFESCAKLFKDINFLRKHLRAKHETFAFKALQNCSDPAMLARYEADALVDRPLPRVAIEAQGGVEYQSVKDILDKHSPRPSVSATAAGGGGGYRGRADGRGNADRRYSEGTHDRSFAVRGDRDDRDRRAPADRAYVPRHGPPEGGQKQTEDAPISNNFRGMGKSAYMDIDAPKEVAAAIDYGVAILPPPKKRKSAGGGGAALAAAAAVVVAAAAASGGEK